MAIATYECQRGSTIAFALGARSGDPTGAACVAWLRKLARGKAVLDPATPIAEEFTVTERPETGGVPAGWTLVLSADASAALDPGFYQADARITIGAEVITTRSWIIEITEPATRPGAMP